MSFLNLSALFFLSLIPVIVIFYLLKLRRKKVSVSSIFLWEKVIQDLQANTPFQKLRRNLLLLLQIIILTLCILALARPFIKAQSKVGQHIVIMLDASASMKATDVSGSRFESAKNSAIQMITNMGLGDKIMIMSVSSQAQVVSNFKSDKKELINAVKKLQPTDTKAKFKPALAMAVSLLQKKRNGEIFIISDGAISSPSDSPFNKGEQGGFIDADIKDIGVNFIKIGKGSNNVAITALDVRKNLASGFDYQIFVSLKNYFPNDVKFNLEFYFNDRLIDVREIEMKAGETVSHVFENTGKSAGLITVKTDLKDDLASDNIAYSFIKEMRKIKVLLVSNGNYFLEKALNLDPSVELYILPPSKFTGSEAYDIIVFDNFAPSTVREGNYIFINDFLKESSLIKITGVVNQPSILDWERTHPVMRFVDFSNVAIAKCLSVSVSQWCDVLLEANQTPIICVAKEKNSSYIFIGFDFYDSNFPLRVGFPILISNSLNWLQESISEQSIPQVKSGNVYPIYVDAKVEKIIVQSPDGKKDEIETDVNPILYDKTYNIGVYSVFTSTHTKQSQFAVNLLDEEESNIAPMEQITVGTKTLKSSDTKVKINQELWKWFAFLALVVLVVEWYVYHKRVFV